MPSAWEFVAAIVCVVVSSIATTMGLFFQKIAMGIYEDVSHRSADQLEDLRNVKRLEWKARAYWISGLLCITLFSFVLDLYSMANLGQAMVVPLLAGLEVAENQLLAPYWLGEHFDKCIDTSAAAIIIVGALTTTLFGPGGPFGGVTIDDPLKDASQSQVMDYFTEMFSASTFIVMEVLTWTLFIFCLVCSTRPRFHRVHFLMVGYVAGFLGGQQNLFLKGVGVLLGAAFRGNHEIWKDWMLYLFVICMLVLAIVQLKFLNDGLARFEALLYVPAYTVIYIFSSTVVGLIFYQEYTLMSELGWAMFVVGFFLISIALAVLTQKTKPCSNRVEAPTQSEKIRAGSGASLSVSGPLGAIMAQLSWKPSFNFTKLRDEARRRLPATPRLTRISEMGRDQMSGVLTEARGALGRVVEPMVTSPVARRAASLTYLVPVGISSPKARKLATFRQKSTRVEPFSPALTSTRRVKSCPAVPSCAEDAVSSTTGATTIGGSSVDDNFCDPSLSSSSLGRSRSFPSPPQSP